MDNAIHIVFTGGGTGGHLFPGLAVAEQLKTNLRRAKITFAGSGKPFERRLVHEAGHEYFALPCRPLPRRAREAVSFVVENFAGYLAAGRFLENEQVAAVVGLGGYASVPMGRAARRRGTPLVLLEQNLVLGKANRWLARSANLLCTSFEQTGKMAPGRCPVRLTGNPIRRLAECLPFVTAEQSVDEPVAGPKQILILGGSGGARSLNENAPRALYKIRDALTGWQIVHQSGEADLEATRDLYRKFGLEATVEAFFGDLPEVMAQTDLAVCRAGGTTLAELAAAGVPAVLLPYPHATDDHQRKNADAFVAAGGALLFDQREVAGRMDDQLAETLLPVVLDTDQRVAMATAIGQLARPTAAADVASLIWSLVSSQSRRERLLAA